MPTCRTSLAAHSASGAYNLKVHDHVANNLFATHLIPGFTWHNFAVQVDWDNLILGVFYSPNNPKLTAVAGLLQNPTISLGATGQGDFLSHKVFCHAYNTKSCCSST